MLDEDGLSRHGEAEAALEGFQDGYQRRHSLSENMREIFFDESRFLMHNHHNTIMNEIVAIINECIISETRNIDLKIISQYSFIVSCSINFILKLLEMLKIDL